MKLIIEFTSDWHIGSGTGVPGSIDSLVVRDRDGLPYVPAKTLTGMLRDGCELVAATLEDCTGGDWAAVVAELFGDQPWGGAQGQPAEHPPRPARIGVRRATFSAQVRALLTDRRRGRLRQALGFVTPHVAIDEESGRAAADKLFFVEVIRAGARLEAPIHFPSARVDGTPETGLSDAQAALLEAGARAVRRLGGKRRRGLGACQLHLEGGRPPPAGHLDWLSWLAQGPAPALAPRTASRAPLPRAATSAPPACVFNYTIAADAPLCVPHRTTGNVVESLDHVPGTMLLPLVHRALDGAGYPDVAGAIRGGAIVVTPAYPLQAGGAASWPVPYALSTRKGGAGLASRDEEVCNLLRAQPRGAQRQGLRTGYVTADCPAAARPGFQKREVRLHMHNTVQDQVQRPTEEVGGVYSYQAIPPGTRLGGEVRIAPPPGTGDDEAARWCDALNRAGLRYAVGRAKKDDYGDVKVVFTRSERAPRPSAAAPGDELTVWLLSDVLLRSRTLAWSTDPADLTAALGAALGISLRLTPAGSGPATAAGRAHRQEGWVRAWDLPRPTLVGLAAGSCFQLAIDADAARRAALPARIAALHLAGIGERRAEGFGQVRIDHPLLGLERLPDGVAPSAERPASATASSPASDPGDREYLRTIEREAWRRMIREAAEHHALDQAAPLGFAKRQPGGPPSSQLGALRTAFTRLRDGDAGRKALICWLVRLMAVQRRAARWPSAAVQQLFRLVEWTPPGEPPDYETWDRLLRAPEGPIATEEPRDPRRRRKGEPPSPEEALARRLRASLELTRGYSWENAHVWAVLFSGRPAGERLPPTCTEGAAAELARELWPFAARALVERTCAAVFDARERGVTGGGTAASGE